MGDAIASEWSGHRPETNSDRVAWTPDAVHSRAVSALRILAARLHASSAADGSDPADVDFETQYKTARDRRSELCISLGSLGVDTRDIVSSCLQNMATSRTGHMSLAPRVAIKREVDADSTVHQAGTKRSRSRENEPVQAAKAKKKNQQNVQRKRNARRSKMSDDDGV